MVPWSLRNLYSDGREILRIEVQDAGDDQGDEQGQPVGNLDGSNSDCKEF